MRLSACAHGSAGPGPARPTYFAYTHRELRAFVGTHLVLYRLEEATRTQGIVVFDRRGTHTVIEPEALARGEPEILVSLDREPLRLRIDVAGPVGDGHRLALFGPEEQGRTPIMLRAGDPRVAFRDVADGAAEFGPLVPGRYSLRWLCGDRYSPPIGGQRALADAERWSIAAPEAVPEFVRIEGWGEILAHVGAPTLRVSCDGHPVSVGADGKLECTDWDGTGSLDLRIDHPAFGFLPSPLPVTLHGPAGDRTLRLPDRLQAVVLRPRVGPGATSPDRALLSRDLVSRVKFDGARPLLMFGLAGSRIVGTIREYADGRSALVATVDVDVQRGVRIYDVELGCREVAVRHAGVDTLVDVEFRSASGAAFAAGSMVLGGGVRRLTIPAGTRAVRFLDGREIVARADWDGGPELFAR